MRGGTRTGCGATPGVPGVARYLGPASPNARDRLLERVPRTFRPPLQIAAVPHLAQLSSGASRLTAPAHHDMMQPPSNGPSDTLDSAPEGPKGRGASSHDSPRSRFAD